MTEYIRVRTLEQFKNNYINRTVSYTYDNKLFFKIIADDCIKDHTSLILSEKEDNDNFLRIAPEWKNTRKPLENKQEDDIKAVDKVKYKLKIQEGAYYCINSIKKNEPYSMFQIIDVDRKYNKEAIFYHGKDGETHIRHDIRSFTCRLLKPFLILQLRDKHSKECMNIYTYYSDTYDAENIYMTPDYDEGIEEYIYNKHSHIIYLPDYKDHIYT